MMRKVKLLACLAGVAVPLLLTAAMPAASDEQFKFVKGIDVGPITSFDISFDDANIHTLAQSHRDDTANCGSDPNTRGGVDLIDTNTNKLIKTLCGFHGGTHEHGPNGNIIVDQKQVWAGDGLAAGGTSTLKAIDIAADGSPTECPGPHCHVMNTGGQGRTDELCEAVSRKIVMAANDRDADLFVTFWDTESYTKLGTLSFKTASKDNKGIVAAGGIEQCKFDPRTQKFLLAVPQPASQPNGGVVVTISPTTFKVEDVFTIDGSRTGCTQGAHGLALGPDHQVLLGCGGPPAGTDNSVIIDDRDGHIIVFLPGVTSDEVWYNPGDNHYFLVPTNPAGTVGTLAPVDAVTGHVDVMATANGSSRVVAADMLKNQVYVVLPGPDDVASGGSGLCPNSANGCIGVYTAMNDDRCLAAGMPVLDHDDGDDPVFMRPPCPQNRDRRADSGR